MALGVLKAGWLSASLGATVPVARVRVRLTLDLTLTLTLTLTRP